MTRAFVDPAALSAQRRRATPELFLHEIAIDEVSERLKDVNRTFTKPAIVGWQARFWADRLGLDGPCVPDTDVLDLQPGVHDLIVHGLCLHWADDPLGQLIQMRRALRPDGLMIAVLFAGETLQTLRMALSTAEAETTGGLSPRIAPMADLRSLGGLLQRAGLALPVADSLPVTTSYETPLHLMRDLRAMGEGNALADRRRVFLRRDTLAAALAQYPMQGDRIEATFELAFLTGWSPHDSQQKPLRPGSAQVSLADVLKKP